MYVQSSCDEPNSATPLPASAITSQDARVTAVGNSFLNGNAALYNLVQSLGGNLPGLIPGAPEPAAAPTPPAAPVYAAPGVLAAPPNPLTVPSAYVGGVRLPSGVFLGSAVSSMVMGCNVPVAGPQLAYSPSAQMTAASDAAWFWGGLGLVFTLWWLGQEGAR